jgi:hypothetical protein
MRVWLVDERSADDAGGLEALLRQLEARPETDLRLLGASPFQPDFVASMRKLLPDLLDLIVISERVWPEGPWTEEVLALGVAVVVVTTADRVERFRILADRHPLEFVLPTVGVEGLWLALVGALAGRHRQAEALTQLGRLQQRLQDRIVIERAKGVLVHRLGITEEDAYKRLRVQSRRQRRQIREIAQVLLDTPDALPEAFTCAPAGAAEPGPEVPAEGILATDR